MFNDEQKQPSKPIINAQPHLLYNSSSGLIMTSERGEAFGKKYTEFRLNLSEGTLLHLHIVPLPTSIAHVSLLSTLSTPKPE